MIFQYLDYPEFQTFYKLIELKSSEGTISHTQLKKITTLAAEYGISADHVRELVSMCE